MGDDTDGSGAEASCAKHVAVEAGAVAGLRPEIAAEQTMTAPLRFNRSGESSSHWTKACYVAIAVTATGSAAAAAAFPAGAPRIAATGADLKRVAAETALTFSVQDIEAEPGKEIPISVNLPSAAELQSAGVDKGVFILIRNIPEGVSVSAGLTTGRVWVVPLREASTLRLLSKPGVAETFQLNFYLMGPNTKSLAETTTTVRLRARQDTVATLGPVPNPEPARSESPSLQPPALVQPPAPPQPLAHLQPPAAAPAPALAPPQSPAPLQPSALPQPVPAPPPPQADALTPQAETALLSRGRDVLRQGGIAAARIIFEELAAHGSAAGALALARTYDPSYAVPSGASAPATNLAEARKWYERAAQLGNPDAKRRLAELAPGG